MKWLILLVSSLAIVYSRPQSQESLQNAKPSIEFTTKVTLLPFYGGAKGQSLQIIETSDGKVITSIVKTPETSKVDLEDSESATEFENPSVPSKYETDEFSDSVRTIQNSALEVIKLQELAKKKGNLSESEEKIYKEHMNILSQSAQNLAQIQEQSNPLDFESREGLSSWFERKSSNKQKEEDKNKTDEKKKKADEKKKKEEDKKKKEEEEKKKIEEEKRKEEEEEKKKAEKEKEEEEEEEEGDGDGVEINLPPEDVSVAEAKPVGLAIAGEGGVAASKPIATAVVGPGGLAIARPVGTAIAGVAPDQALVPIYAEGYISGSKPRRTTAGTKNPASEYLSRLISKYHQS